MSILPTFNILPVQLQRCVKNGLVSSVGTVLIFLFSPTFGTEASVPAFPRCRGLVQGFQRVTRIFLILDIVRFHLGTIPVQNQEELEALVLEPKLTGT